MLKCTMLIITHLVLTTHSCQPPPSTQLGHTVMLFVLFAVSSGIDKRYHSDFRSRVPSGIC